MVRITERRYRKKEPSWQRTLNRDVFSTLKGYETRDHVPIALLGWNGRD